MRFPTNPVILGNKYGPRKVFDAGGFPTAAYHRGLDLLPGKAGAQVPIHALADGTVRATSLRGGPYNATAGHYVLVEHPGPWRLTTGRLLPTIWAGYCHLSSFIVRPSQRLREGQTLGRMGSSGASTGVHLHLDIFDRNPYTWGAFDSRIDPLTLLSAGATAGAATLPAPEEIETPITEEMTMAIIGRLENYDPEAFQYIWMTESGVDPIVDREKLDALREVKTKIYEAQETGHHTIALTVFQARTYRDHTNRAAGRGPYVPDIPAK